MKRLNLSLLLFTLLLLTACNLHTVFDQELSEQKMHPETMHSLSYKEIPDIYRFHSIEHLNLRADSAVLVNTKNGDTLFDKNSHEPKAVASMSKIMSELLVLEGIEAEIIDWEEPVKISDYAYTISHQPGYASILLEKDQSYTIDDLFHGMAVTSANGSTIALAEKVAGSEKEFVKLMNKKAEALGLDDSHFVNSTGLTNHDLKNHHTTGSLDDYNEMSAHDLAVLANYIIKNYPDLLTITSLTKLDIQNETYENSNWMLPGASENFSGIDVTFPGVDGFKTGFTSEAGYGFTGTVEIDGTRFISVVIGTDAIEERFLETAKLYEGVLKQVKDEDN